MVVITSNHASIISGCHPASCGREMKSSPEIDVINQDLDELLAVAYVILTWRGLGL